MDRDTAPVMFVHSILDGSEKTGTVDVTVADSEGHTETFMLSAGEWKRLNKTAPIEHLGEVDEELYDRLTAAAERTITVREAAAILTNGDKSASAILRKLTQKGRSKESAEYAVELLKKRGYLNEEDACRRIAEALVRSKHYGRRRVRDYLISHGYDAKTAEIAAEEIPDEEIREALTYHLTRKFRNYTDLPMAERKKATASLMRLGFTWQEIQNTARETEQN